LFVEKLSKEKMLFVRIGHRFEWKLFECTNVLNLGGGKVEWKYRVLGEVGWGERRGKVEEDGKGRREIRRWLRNGDG
jgi:hypothetical protein